MYDVSDMTAKTVISEVVIRVPFLLAALRRDTMMLSKPGDFKVTHVEGQGYLLDFGDSENLDIFDRFQTPYLSKLLKRADHLGIRTAVTQLLKPEGVMAIELESVSALTFNELSDHLLFRNGVGGMEAPETTEGIGARTEAVILPFSKRHIA